jgi:hypothetical protein
MHLRLCTLATLVFFVACSSPPKPTTPALTPQQANELLHYNNKAENWMVYVRKHNPACGYELDLPDQTSHPATIDLDHIVSCSGRPSPREFDASVSFAYDKDQQKWVITRFSS